MPQAVRGTWYPMDARDIASARDILCAAQSTLGNPATLVQKLLGLTADDYQEVVQSLSASGASYVDIVAAYLHNLRVLYDDCGGQFPPELVSLAANEGIDFKMNDTNLAVTMPKAQAAKLGQVRNLPTSPVVKPPNQTRMKPAISVAVPHPSKLKGQELAAFELLNSPTSTLVGPTLSYGYGSSSPTSPSSIGSPRDSTPPLLSPQASWQAQQVQQAAWQQAAQQAALDYQNLIAQCSLQVQPTSLAMNTVPMGYGASSPHAMMSSQTALNSGHNLPGLMPISTTVSSAAQQYLDALACSLRQSGMPSAVLEAQTASAYCPARPCAFSAFSPVHADQAATSPNGGLNYDVIKRIWDGPRVL